MASNSIFLPCLPRLSCTSFGRQLLLKKHKRNQQKAAVIKNHKASSFTYTFSHDLPLIELPGASFDEYMEDKGRLIRIIVPEKATVSIPHAIEDEWSIKMPLIQALFLTFRPVIHATVTCKSNGEDYPPHVPRHITKLIHIHTTKWELEGLDADYMPPYMKFKAAGSLYPERQQGTRMCIKYELKIDISVVFPPLLALVPEYVMHNILDSIIRTNVEDMKKGFTARLTTDYRSFNRNKSKYSM